MLERIRLYFIKPRVLKTESAAFITVCQPLVGVSIFGIFVPLVAMGILPLLWNAPPGSIRWFSPHLFTIVIGGLLGVAEFLGIWGFLGEYKKLKSQGYLKAIQYQSQANLMEWEQAHARRND